MTDRPVIPVALTAAFIALAPANAGGQARVVAAEGAWAALDRGAECDALTRSVRIAPRGSPQASAGFAFSRDRRQWGEFRARLSRVPRQGSSAMTTIGGQPFLLVAGGGWAWSRGPAQGLAMIAAVRASPGMRIEARDGAGRRIVDLYDLAGAPTAIDAAAARCAATRAGKI